MRSEEATASATATPLRKLEAAAETRARVKQARHTWRDGFVAGAALMVGFVALLRGLVPLESEAPPALAGAVVAAAAVLAISTWPRAEAPA